MFSPGGTSFGNPIQLRGHSLRSWPKSSRSGEPAACDWGAACDTVRGFAFRVRTAMDLTTLLNQCSRARGFVYEGARFSADKQLTEVRVRPRRGSDPTCR